MKQNPHYLRHVGKLIARFFQAIVPDPFVLAILLTVLTFGLVQP